MTSLVKAIQERLAKICEDITHYPDPVTGVMHMQESHFTHPGNHKCAAAIRAADLSDLEPKMADHSGIYPRTGAASVICACGVTVPQNICNGIESDLVHVEALLTAAMTQLTTLEPKVMEGATPRTKVEEYSAIANTNSALLANDKQYVVSSDFARKLELELTAAKERSKAVSLNAEGVIWELHAAEAEIAALTARLEAAEGELDKHHNLTAVERLQAISAMKTAHNFLQEHWSGNPDWKKGNEHLWIARADFELERGIEALAKDSYE